MPAETNAVVTSRIALSDELAILRMTPDGWDIPEFKAGQFTTIGLPKSAPRCAHSLPNQREIDAEKKAVEAGKAVDPDKLVKRAYSIASSAVDRPYIEFYINMVKDGEFTPRLFHLNIGDRVWLSPKITGHFTLDESPADANLVFVATGTGLAPYMSMLRSHFRTGFDRRVAVLHGVRHSWDLGYADELLLLERLFPQHFCYLPVVSRPKEEPMPWKGPAGHVQAAFESGLIEKRWGFAPNAGHTHVYLCGNPAMIDGMVALLTASGYAEHSKREPNGQIHHEKYW